MTQSIDIHTLKIEDIHYILDAIQETVDIYEYPTSAIFSAITRCSLVTFLKGAGYSKDLLEKGSVSLFRQLNEYAHTNSEYVWFIEWSRRLADLVKERKVLE